MADPTITKEQDEFTCRTCNCVLGINTTYDACRAYFRKQYFANREPERQKAVIRMSKLEWQLWCWCAGWVDDLCGLVSVLTS